MSLFLINYSYFFSLSGRLDGLNRDYEIYGSGEYGLSNPSEGEGDGILSEGEGYSNPWNDYEGHSSPYTCFQHNFSVVWLLTISLIEALRSNSFS
jgi:hypothetical protein